MAAIRRGFSSLGVEELETALEQGGENGFDFVELTMNDYGRTELAGKAEQVRMLAETYNIDILVHLPYGDDDVAIGSSDEAAQRASEVELQECIRTAGSIGAEKAVLHIETSDGAPHLLEVDGLDRLVERLIALDNFASRHGVELCIENMLHPPPQLEDLATLVDHTDISLTVDTGHARANGHTDANITTFVRKYADYISHFHLNDTRRAEDEHLPFGAGTIDFEGILAALPDDWAGTLSLEIYTHDYDYITFSGQKLDALL